MEAEINTLTFTRVPRGLTELITLGRTRKRQAGDHGLLRQPHTPATAPPKPSAAASNTYAAPPQDLRNLTHYITRSLLETGGFKPQLHPQL